MTPTSDAAPATATPLTAPIALTALALVCSLKPSPAASSSELMASQILDELAGHGVTGSSVRVVDYDVKPGVETDMGDGDQWPTLRDQILAADILVMVTPTWMGQASSVATAFSNDSTQNCLRWMPRADLTCTTRLPWSEWWATKTVHTTSPPCCTSR
jgi:hypothetical protein